MLRRLGPELRPAVGGNPEPGSALFWFALMCGVALLLLPGVRRTALE